MDLMAFLNNYDMERQKAMRASLNAVIDTGLPMADSLSGGGGSSTTTTTTNDYTFPASNNSYSYGGTTITNPPINISTPVTDTTTNTYNTNSTGGGGGGGGQPTQQQPPQTTQNNNNNNVNPFPQRFNDGFNNVPIVNSGTAAFSALNGVAPWDPNQNFFNGAPVIWTGGASPSNPGGGFAGGGSNQGGGGGGGQRATMAPQQPAPPSPQKKSTDGWYTPQGSGFPSDIRGSSFAGSIGSGQMSNMGGGMAW